MQVILMRKREDGPPEKIDGREWTAEMIAALEHANYLLLDGREYEMLEGRLDVLAGSLELLVDKVVEQQRV